MKLGYVVMYVEDVAEAADFYEKAFGMSCSFVHESKDFALMESDGAAISFTSHRLAAQVVPTEYVRLSSSQTPPGLELTLIADSVDDAFARAVGHGAEALSQPHDEPWGQRVAYVRDSWGTIVGIAAPIPTSDGTAG